LSVNLQSTSGLFEWEGASLVIKTGALSTFSFEFFFSYFSYFSADIIASPLLSSALDPQMVCLLTVTPATNQLMHIAGLQWDFRNLISSLPAFFTYRGFYALSQQILQIFTEIPAAQLYADWSRQVAAAHVILWQTGTFGSLIAVSASWLFEISYSFDWFILAVECALLLFLLNYTSRATDLFSHIRVFYDDIVTFCKLNNISLVEVGVFFTFFLGFIIFDIFMCASDEDVTDVFSYFMVTFVILLFFFLILGIDVQYYYMISSVSSGDLTLRVIAFDVINNFLCILRIFFCWVRYIFYDLQVELVDFSFHYTDAVNDITALALYNNFNAANWFSDGLAPQHDSSVLAVTRTAFWAYIYIYVDVCFVILQILLGFVKLFIAFFLLWLIVDLFILKAFAHSESNLLNYLRRK